MFGVWKSNFEKNKRFYKEIFVKKKLWKDFTIFYDKSTFFFYCASPLRPVLETLSFYNIFPVLETLSFYDIFPVPPWRSWGTSMTAYWIIYLIYEWRTSIIQTTIQITGYYKLLSVTILVRCLLVFILRAISIIALK